jgi:hypothetical protein
MAALVEKMKRASEKINHVVLVGSMLKTKNGNG